MKPIQKKRKKPEKLSQRVEAVASWNKLAVTAEAKTLYESGLLECNGQCLTWKSHLSEVSCPVHEVRHSETRQVDKVIDELLRKNRSKHHSVNLNLEWL